MPAGQEAGRNHRPQLLRLEQHAIVFRGKDINWECHSWNVSA